MMARKTKAAQWLEDHGLVVGGEALYTYLGRVGGQRYVETSCLVRITGVGESAVLIRRKHHLEIAVHHSRLT